MKDKGRMEVEKCPAVQGPGEHIGKSGHFPIVIQNPTNIFNQESKMIKDRFYDHSSMETGIITLFIFASS